jgi:hypothetical protein
MIVLTLVGLVAVAGLLPAGVLAQAEPVPTPETEPGETPTAEADADSDSDADDADVDAPEIEVEYDEGVITVEDDAGPVSNVTVTVTAENETYTGTYTTDENGTVVLPVGDAASNESLTIATTVDGVIIEETVVVDEDREFVVGGEGSDADDAAPVERIPFGQRVSMFVDSLLGGSSGNGSIGQAISEFVRANNPSSDRGNAGEAGVDGRERAANATQNGTDTRANAPDRPNTSGGDRSPPSKTPSNTVTDGADESDADEKKDRQRGNGRGNDAPRPLR